MNIIQCEQGSKEWFTCRMGIPTASEFDKIVDSKGNPSKQREKYLYQLAGEKISKVVEESYQNADILRGKELEDEARKFYELKAKKNVVQVGFCITERDCIYGASPDGLVGDSGLLEIKCPKIYTHVGYLVDNKLPVDYTQQIQGQLLVTNRNWVDFMSYYPGMKPFIIRAKRDEKFIFKLRKELFYFCVDLKKLAKKIK